MGTAPQPRRRPGAAPRWRGPLLRLLASGLAVAWVLSRIDAADAGRWLAAAPRWLYFAPAALLVVNSGVHAARLAVLLGGATPRVPWSRIYLALLQASFIGVVLPSGGAEVAKVALLARPCGAPERALAAILLARLAELAPWTLLLLWGLAWGLWAHDPLVGAAAAVFAAGFTAALLLAAVARRRGADLAARLPAPLRRLASRLPARVRALGPRLRAAFAQVGADPRRLLGALLLTVPFSLVNCLVVYVIARGYGLSVGYADILALVPAVDTLIALPVSLNGVGVRESLFVDLLAPWGATPALGVAIALTRWGGELGRAAVGGLLFLLEGGWRALRREAPGVDEDP